MKKLMTDLLATDALARPFGVALNPKLRAAIEADLRFPVRAATPLPTSDQIRGPLPENVVRLAPHKNEADRSTA